MTETASLILKVDSSGAAKATDDLDRLSGASARTEQATKRASDEFTKLTNRIFPATKRADELARLQELVNEKFKAGEINAQQYANAVGRIENEQKKVNKALAEYDQVADDSEKTTTKLDSALSKYFGRLVAGVSVTAGLGLMIRNTIRAEQQLAQLDAILTSTGNAAGYSRDQLVGMAEGMSKASTFSRGEIIEAQTRLLSYSGIVGENVPRAMQAVIDQSTRLGISLAQSSETIGRALESPSKAAAALAQQGFGAAFTEEVRNTIDALVDAGREGDAQIMILEILEESYAGAAKAARETFGGALSALKNTLGDLMSGRDGSLNGATEAVDNLIDTLNDPGVQDGFTGIVSGAMKAVEWLGKFVATTASVTKFLGEEVAARVHGAALGDTVRIEQAIERQRRVLAQMDQVRMIGDRVPAGYDAVTGAGAGRMNTSAAAQEGRAELQRLQERLRLSREMAAETARLAAIKPPELPSLASVDLSGLDTRSRSDKEKAAREAAQAAKKALDEEKRATEALQRDYDGYLGRLHQSIELHGENSNLARTNYEILHGSLKGISDAQADILREAAEWQDWLQEMAVIEEVWADAAQERTDRMIKGWEKATDEMSEFARQAARNMQSAFADFLFDPFEDGLSGMLRRFADTLRRMAAEAVASKLFDALGQWGQQNSGQGGWAGVIASFFGAQGGGKAAGGPLMAGQSYMVGDGGKPELFVPSTSGRLYPMGQGGGGGGNVTVNVHNAPAGTRVEQSRGANGGMQIDVLIDGIERSLAARTAQGGPIAGAVKGRFGLREATG